MLLISLSLSPFPASLHSDVRTNKHNVKHCNSAFIRFRYINGILVGVVNFDHIISHSSCVHLPAERMITEFYHKPKGPIIYYITFYGVE